MSATSNYLENKLLDHVLRDTEYEQVETVYVALFDNESTATAANLEADIISDEINGGNYIRQEITFDEPAGGATANSETITFPPATADYGVVTHAAIMDAETDGHVLFWSELETDKLIEVDDIFQITSGQLTVILT